MDYFQTLQSEYKSSLMCDWVSVRRELDKADKDVFVTFRNKTGTNSMPANKTLGLGIASISETKATILHLSTLSLDDFVEACRLMCSYLTNNSRVGEVLIN